MEKFPGGADFALSFVPVSHCVVSIGIADLDLDEVINQAKLQHALKGWLQLAPGMKQHGEETHVPGVVGVALFMATIREVYDSIVRLEPFSHAQKRENLPQTARVY